MRREYFGRLVRAGCDSGFAVGGCHGVQGGAGGDGCALDGRGGVDLEEVEEMIGGNVGQAARIEHGEDAVFANGFMESADEVLFGDGAFAEVLFHEIVFAFGD